MKKIIFIIGILVFLAFVLIVYSNKKGGYVESTIPYEQRETAPEAYNQSFRKTESSIPPPSINMEYIPTEEPSM